MKKCIKRLAGGSPCPNDALVNRNYCAVHVNALRGKSKGHLALSTKRAVKKKVAKKR